MTLIMIITGTRCTYHVPLTHKRLIGWEYVYQRPPLSLRSVIPQNKYANLKIVVSHIVRLCGRRLVHFAIITYCGWYIPIDWMRHWRDPFRVDYHHHRHLMIMVVPYPSYYYYYDVGWSLFQYIDGPSRKKSMFFLSYCVCADIYVCSSKLRNEVAPSFVAATIQCYTILY